MSTAKDVILNILRFLQVFFHLLAMGYASNPTTKDSIVLGFSMTGTVLGLAVAIWKLCEANGSAQNTVRGFKLGVGILGFIATLVLTILIGVGISTSKDVDLRFWCSSVHLMADGIIDAFMALFFALHRHCAVQKDSPLTQQSG